MPLLDLRPTQSLRQCSIPSHDNTLQKKKKTYLLPHNRARKRRERIYHLPQPLWTKHLTTMLLNQRLQLCINTNQIRFSFFEQSIDIRTRWLHCAHIWRDNLLRFTFLNRGRVLGFCRRGMIRHDTRTTWSGQGRIGRMWCCWPGVEGCKDF
jgi:hypothetical protein